MSSLESIGHPLVLKVDKPSAALELPPWKSGEIAVRLKARLARDAKASHPSISLAVISAYLAGAYLNLLKWCLKVGMRYMPEEMDRT